MIGHFFHVPEENNYQPKIGDRVRIRNRVPLYGGSVGTVTSLDNGVHVEFHIGTEHMDLSSCVFDEDDIVKHERGSR